MRIHELDFAGLYRNPIFLSGLTSLILAQLIKTIITLFRTRKAVAKDALFAFFWRTGGMPSSHSATAVSICAAIAFTEGFNDVFILSLFVTLITIRDALGVRRAAGLQAKALNRLGGELAEQNLVKYEPVKEVHGHTLAEVMVGSLLGLGIALFFCAR